MYLRKLKIADYREYNPSERYGHPYSSEECQNFVMLIWRTSFILIVNVIIILFVLKEMYILMNINECDTFHVSLYLFRSIWHYFVVKK